MRCLIVKFIAAFIVCETRIVAMELRNDDLDLWLNAQLTIVRQTVGPSVCTTSRSSYNDARTLCIANDRHYDRLSKIESMIATRCPNVTHLKRFTFNPLPFLSSSAIKRWTLLWIEFERIRFVRHTFWFPAEALLTCELKEIAICLQDAICSPHPSEHAFARLPDRRSLSKTYVCCSRQF